MTCYLVGWVRKNATKEEAKTSNELSEHSKIYITCLISFWFICSTLTVKINEDTYIGTLAGSTLLSGQAQQYKQENEERLELLHDNSMQDVVLQGFSNPPKLLMFQDITNNENEWLNEVMAQYYGKGSVRRE